MKKIKFYFIDIYDKNVVNNNNFQFILKLKYCYIKIPSYNYFQFTYYFLVFFS